MKDSKAVKLIALAYAEGYNEGHIKGYSYSYEADERAEEAYEQGRLSGLEQGRREALSAEALAQAKSPAYDRGYAQAQEEAHKVGYARGLAEGQARAAKPSEEAYNSGLKAGVEAERERALAAEPKLQVWFKPCGPVPVSSAGEVLGYPPGIDKIKAIKAIREAYDSGEGYGLKDVKDMVEAEHGARVPAGEPLSQSKAVALYLQLQSAGFEPSLRN